jgi:hypothetical protein
VDCGTSVILGPLDLHDWRAFGLKEIGLIRFPREVIHTVLSSSSRISGSSCDIILLQHLNSLGRLKII